MADHRIKLPQESNFAFHPPTLTPLNPLVAQTSMRPSTLPFNGQRHPHQSFFTPNDYDKLILSTPELDARACGYTTPELINALTTPSNTDEQPSPGAKILEDMLNVHSANLHHARSLIPGNHPFMPTRPVETERDKQEQQHLAYSYQASASVTPNSLRNRSISSSFHDNDSSNSTNASSPVSSHLSSNHLTDELQHVPSDGRKSSGEGPDVVRKEKKRERNRQAAQKCRTRKLTRIAELQKRVNDLQGKNKDLTGLAESLKTDVFRLEKQLEDHRTQGCALMSHGMLG